MHLIISHDSALEFWRRFRGPISCLPRTQLTAPMQRPVRIDSNIKEELGEAGFAFGKEQPLDLLFALSGTYSQAIGIHSHRTGRPLQPGSLMRFSDHILIVSPELCFAQIAATRPMGRLLMAGCEMCGTYLPTAPAERPEERGALTSADRLRAFLSAMGLGARSRACRVAGQVFDGAASPMEAKLALLLSLPQTMGGYGLPRPALNAPVKLGAEAFRVYPRRECHLDLSWPGTNLDVEYEGRIHNEERRDSDNARIVALRLEGIDVYPLRRQQVYDARAMLPIARDIAEKLGWRLRMTTRDFWTRHRQLRRELEL